MPANIRETLIAFSKNRQANATTASASADMWRMRKINADIDTADLITENDANEIGGGNEFAANVYKVSNDMKGKLEKFLSSEWAAFVMTYSLDGGAKTGDGTPWVYTCVPQDPVNDVIELPYFSLLQHIRRGGSPTDAILDRVDIGLMLSGWQLNILSGPGRESSKLSADFVGIGKFTSPSTIDMPSETTENLLSSSTLAMTLNGVNYVSSKKIQSLEATWNNNPRLDRRYHPGSGSQDGFAIGSRVEFGDRAATLKFTADMELDSTELATQIAQTDFTATISITKDANHSLTLTYHRLRFGNGTKITNNNGIVTISGECDVLWHTSNGLFTAVVNTTTDEVCEAA